MSEKGAEARALRVGASNEAAPSGVGLSPAIIVLIECTVVMCLWLVLFPLRHAASAEVSWDGHVALALLPALVWFVLVGQGRPAWWLRRGGAGLVAASRAWPLIAVATSPAYPAIFSRSFQIEALPVLFLFGLGSAFLLVLTAMGLGLRGARSAERAEMAASSIGDRLLAIGGLSCVLSLSGMEDWAGIEWSWTRWFLELARDGLRWGGVIGVAGFLAGRADRFPRLSLGLYLWYRRRSRRGVLAFCCLASMLLSGLFAWYVLDGVPHLQDEIAMIFQAKNLASGRLYSTAPPMPEFFDMEFVVRDGQRWYGKYQLGPSVWYLPGVMLDCAWLVSPLFSGLAVIVLYLLAREILGAHRCRGVVVLAVISPWWLMTFGSMMAHPGCLLVLSASGLFFVRAVRRPQGWSDAALAGVFLGLGIHFRPYTALLIGGVMAIAGLVGEWRRNLGLRNATAFLVPVVGFGALMASYNWALTGDALAAPFAMWSETDRLGFGPDRGLYAGITMGFTLADGIENVQMQLQALGTSAMGWPAATLALPILAVVFGGAARRCRLLVLVPVALIVGYFFYHYGWPIYYGVRYWSESLPAFLMLTLVGLEVLRRWYRSGLRLAGVRAASARSRVFLAWMVSLLAAGNVFGYLPSVVEQYHEGVEWASCSVAHDVARERGLENALVFMDTAHYGEESLSMDWYGAGFWTMSPDLMDEVLFVRDLGEERNQELMTIYPERACFRLIRYGPRLAELRPYSEKAEEIVRPARRDLRP